MDRGTNAVNVLKNEVVPLRLGYIGRFLYPLDKKEKGPNNPKDKVELSLAT